MKWNAALLTAWCLMGSGLLAGQVPPKADVELTAPDIPGVVARGTKVQVLGTFDEKLGGEGPISMPDGSLLFTHQDVMKVMKIDNKGTISTYLDTTPNQALALAYDLKGRLIATHRGTPTGIVAIAPARAVVADKFQGRPFGRPNDLVIDAKGGVYFSDNSSAEPGQPPPANKSGVYYVKPDGQVIYVTDSPANGVQLSPDGKILYVCSGSVAHVRAFDVQPDGSATNGRDHGLVGKPGNGADGMAVDAAGRLYVVMNEGVKVFSPQGQALGTIPIPVRGRNVAFGGPDRKSLYIVTRGGAYKVAMLSEGIKGRAK